MPPEPPIDPVLNGFEGGVLLLSLATSLYVAIQFRRGPVLPYEPRRPVPWGAPAALLALVFAAIAIISSSGSGDGEAPAVHRDATEMATGLLGSLVVELALVVSFVFAVKVISEATAVDLGLPASRHVLARDVLIGVVGCLAVLAPVVLLQAVLMLLFNLEESGHELVKMVIEGQPNLLVLVLASVAAVVVAPTCEEIMFRLLLQGWLEKWEDERLGWRRAAAEGLDAMAEPGPGTDDEARITNDESFAPDHSSLVIGHSGIPPARGVAGIPYGWAPILISSLFFAAAHFGYGPEPVPLFFLALVLGYVYQRTHRIVPGIVIHALFNSFTVIILWRIVLSGAK